MDPLTYVGLIAFCLVASAFFSGSETALLRLRAHQVEEDVKAARGPAAVAVRDLLRSTSRLLVTILLGNNVVNILGSAAAAALCIHYFGERGIVVATVVWPDAKLRRSMTFLVVEPVYSGPIRLRCRFHLHPQ